MTSYKEIHLNVLKDYDYMPIGEDEKKRISKIILSELIEIVERFDGPARVTIVYEVKGNC